MALDSRAPLELVKLLAPPNRPDLWQQPVSNRLLPSHESPLKVWRAGQGIAGVITHYTRGDEATGPPCVTKLQPQQRYHVSLHVRCVMDPVDARSAGTALQPAASALLAAVVGHKSRQSSRSCVRAHLLLPTAHLQLARHKRKHYKGDTQWEAHYAAVVDYLEGVEKRHKEECT